MYFGNYNEKKTDLNENHSVYYFDKPVFEIYPEILFTFSGKSSKL
jgi:hypothetical protein